MCFPRECTSIVHPRIIVVVVVVVVEYLIVVAMIVGVNAVLGPAYTREGKHTS